MLLLLLLVRDIAVVAAVSFVAGSSSSRWRASHSQVCSIENRYIYIYLYTYILVRMSLLPFDL